MKPETILDNYTLLAGPVEVEALQVLGGANYFSGGPVVLMQINLHEFDEIYTNQINGFFESLSKAMPSLIEHHCSEGVRGGFFMRVLDGTLLGHVIEHTAIELQTMAGMDVNYGKTRSTRTQGVYNVIFRFKDVYAGQYAGKAAANLVNSILLGLDFNVEEVIQQLIAIREERLLGPSTQSIVDAALDKKIPWLRLDDYNLIQLGSGKFQKRLRSTLSSDTAAIAAENVRDRVLSLRMLRDAGIPTARVLDPTSPSNEHFPAILTYAYRSTDFPDIKIPIFESANLQAALAAFDKQRPLLLWKQPSTICWRYLCIGGKLIAVSRVVPPTLIGDSIHSVSELLAMLNEDPKREIGDKGNLGKVALDSEVEAVLNSQNVDLKSIPEKGSVLHLAGSANPKNGSSSSAYSEFIHQRNIFIIEKAARIMGLDIAGIDVYGGSPDIAFDESDAIITEVFAAPNLRVHINPSEGKAVDVANAILDHLFPPGSPMHIPLISVTGSKGKTSCIGFIYECLVDAMRHPGLVSSSGLFIGNECISYDKMASHEAAAILLKDPDIDCALIETSIEDISHYGLAYDYADYGIVLNICEDDIENSEFHCLEDLSYAKSVVAEEVYAQGLSVLNADDPLVAEMAKRCPGEIAIFSHQESNVPLDIAAIPSLKVWASSTTINISTKGGKTHSFGPVSDDCINNQGMIYDSILAAVAVLSHMDIPDELINKHLLTYQSH